MNVKDLIKVLEGFDKELPVGVAYQGNYLDVEISFDKEVEALLISPGQTSIAMQRFGPGRDDESDVHTEHCCYFCSCKYGNEACTVRSGKLRQRAPHLDTSVCYDMKPGYWDDY